MATALEILELANTQSRAAADNINRALDSSSRLQESRQQFAQEMEFKKLQLDESARVSDANIFNAQAANYLRFKEFELEASLRPEKIKAMNIQIATAETQQKRMLQEHQEQSFNSITKDVDTKVGSIFSQNQNPDFARSYMDLKTKFRGSVARGEKPNVEGFQKEVDDLISSYKNIPIDNTYRPETVMLLKQFGDNVGAARMEGKNPLYQGNKQAIILNAILSGGKEAARIVGEGQNQNIFQDSAEISNIVSSGYEIENIDKEMTRLQKEVQAFQLIPTKGSASPETVQTAKDQLRRSTDELKSLKSRRDGIMKRFMTNAPDTYGINETISRSDAALSKADKEAEQIIGKFAKGPVDSDPNYDLLTRQSKEAPRIAALFPEAFPADGQSYAYLEGINVADDKGHRDFIKKNVWNNLNKLIDEDGESKIDLMLSSDSIDEAFRTLSGKGETGSLYPNTAGFYLGEQPWYREFASYLGESVGDTATSKEDIIKRLRQIQDPEKRSLAKRRILTDIISAAFIQSMSK